MPLFYQHNINPGTKLGIWKIEEPESFFLARVPLKRDVSHPFKRMQHLAGRYLLPFLFDDFPLEKILIADTRKPFLESEKFHFSISHCGAFAAAIVSKTERVGVDIERIGSRIRSVTHKFMTEQENKVSRITGDDPDSNAYSNGAHAGEADERSTLVWCAKEAIFKWHGLGAVDFRKHIQMSGAITRTEEGLSMPFVFCKDGPTDLLVHAKIFPAFILTLAWVAT